MAKERQDYEDHESSLTGKNGASVLAAETLRRGADRPADDPSPRSEERISVFWRVFGGTLLSIAALVVITVYNQFSGTLTDLRKEVNQLYEARAELLRKDEFNNRLSSVWMSIKDLQTTTQGLAALGERAKVLDQHLERQVRNADDDRKEVARKIEEVRKSGEEERKDILRKLEDNRKAVEAERADALRQLDEQRRNDTYERKELLARMDEQRRAFEDDRKEMSGKLQALAERLAKVEGRQAGKSQGTPKN